jgi:D-tagatose-1,6-bisphosphate aldolase subunit GatZ/KbaZ
LKEAVLSAMRREPKYWKPYYSDPKSQAFDLQYSLSDRIRYYWNVPDVQRATAKLLEDLSQRGIPLTLLSQYLPEQYAAARAGTLTNDPRQLLLDGVARVLSGYARACRPDAAVTRTC